MHFFCTYDDRKEVIFTCLYIGLSGIGLAVGIHCCHAPVLLSEYSPRYYRPFMLAMLQLCTTLGILSCLGINTIFNNVGYGWQWVLLFSLIPVLIQSVLCYYVPRSPRWLLMQHFIVTNNQLQLHKSSSINHDENETKSEDWSQVIMTNESYLKEAEEAFLTFWKSDQSAQTIGIREFNVIEYKTKHYLSDRDAQKQTLRNGLIIGTCLNIFQQLSGINIAINKITDLLCQNLFSDRDDFSLNSWFAPLILNVTEVLITIFVVKSIQKYPYKQFILSGILLMLTSIVVFAILLIIDVISDNKCKNCDNWVSTLILFAIYIIGFALSLGPFTWVITTELFVVSLKAKYFSFCVFLNFVFNFLAGSDFVPQLRDIDYQGNETVQQIFTLLFVMAIIGSLCTMGGFIVRLFPKGDAQEKNQQKEKRMGRNTVLLEESHQNYRRFI